MDWVVQSRINDSLQRSQACAGQVSAALAALSGRLATAQSALDQVQAARRQQLEQLS